MFRNLALIFLGGGLGSVARFGLATFTQKWSGSAVVPAGTFMVNILGCLLIGVLSGYFMRHDGAMKFLLITGFCGGFTTFSTFSAENYSLLQSGDYGLLFLNIILSVGLGLAAVLLGFQLAKNF